MKNNLFFLLFFLLPLYGGLEDFEPSSDQLRRPSVSDLAKNFGGSVKQTTYKRKQPQGSGIQYDQLEESSVDDQLKGFFEDGQYPDESVSEIQAKRAQQANRRNSLEDMIIAKHKDEEPQNGAKREDAFKKDLLKFHPSQLPLLQGMISSLTRVTGKGLSKILRVMS